MTKGSSSTKQMPAAGAQALRQLGSDLSLARKRRKQSLSDWAMRLGVSVPTLMRMEAGEPAVSAGVYATALWLIQRQGALGQAADPKEDLAALESDIADARRRHQREGERNG